MGRSILLWCSFDAPWLGYELRLRSCFYYPTLSYVWFLGPISSCLAFFLFCLVLSMSETQSYAWVLSLVVFVFAPGPIMFRMGAVALGSICWPEVVLWNWFQW